MAAQVRVLYIDDEVDTEKFASRCDLLEQRGMAVTPVQSVAEAGTIIGGGLKDYDVIVLDIIMPPEDYYTLQETGGGTRTGLRLLQDLRERDTQIPVVIVSVRRIDEIKPLIEQFHVAQFLTKPVTTDVVADAIEAAVGRTE